MVDQKLNCKSLILHCFQSCHHFLNEFSDYKLSFIRNMCYIYFLTHYKTHSMKALESNSKIQLKSTCEL
jgi:hypothetical protein